MTEPAARSPRVSGRPADDVYARPLERLYPPLGFGPDGMPRTVGPQPVSTPAPAAPDPTTTSPVIDGDTGVDDSTPMPRRTSSNRGLWRGLALVVVLVVGLFLIVHTWAGRNADTVTQPPVPITLPTLPTIMPTIPSEGPGAQPGLPANPTAPIGREVVYQVMSTTSTTIIYVDPRGLRTMIGAPNTWSVTFTATSNPLRILVLAGGGAASCTITVDGRVVATDQITEESPRRTVSCRG
ncbi:hypothetical protein ACWDTI_03135 [Gordonia sp. NPDC003424]